MLLLSSTFFEVCILTTVSFIFIMIMSNPNKNEIVAVNFIFFKNRKWKLKNKFPCVAHIKHQLNSQKIYAFEYLHFSLFRAKKELFKPGTVTFYFCQWMDRGTMQTHTCYTLTNNLNERRKNFACSAKRLKNECNYILPLMLC